MNMRDLIIQESIKLKALHDNIYFYYNKRGKSNEYKNACAEFHAYQSPMMKYFSKASLNELKTANKEKIEFALTFLEIDPYFFRSGYLKEDLLRKLKFITFSDSEKTRLIDILINAVKNNSNREFKFYCKLARKNSTSLLENKLNELKESPDGHIKNRAELMLKYIKKE